MKTLGIVCTSTGFGGLEMNTLKLAGLLDILHGWQVRLLLNGNGPMHGKALAAGLDAATIQDFKSSAIKASSRIIKQWQAQAYSPVLLTTYNDDISALSRYKRFNNSRIKLVYQQHMRVGVRKRSLVHRLRYKALDAWVSPLQYLKDETLMLTPVPENKISVIPFGIDAAYFAEQPLTQEAARARLGLPPDVLLLGVCGRIDPQKGQDFMIRAIHQLQQQSGAGYHLLIMGAATPGEGDAYLEKLHGLVQDLGLAKQIHFRPFRPDVLPFYNAIDVFAMPSHYETYGMVTLEAMAAGVPVIGVDKGGTHELLADGAFGYLHRPEDLDDFCNQLQELLQSPTLSTRLQEARNEVFARYTEEQMCRDTDKLLISLTPE